MNKMWMKQVAVVSVALLTAGVAGCDGQQKSGTVTASVQGSAGGRAHGVQDSWTSTRREDIKDPGDGMTAFTMAVPAGWQFAGTLLRPGGCHAPVVPAYGLSYEALSPDGVTMASALPGVSWIWASNGTNFQGAKCPANVDIDTAAKLLVNIVIPNVQPNAQNVKLPKLGQGLLDAMAAESAKATAQLRQYGIKGRAYTDAAVARVEFDYHGQPVEENIFLVIDCREVQTQPVMKPAYTQRTCNSRGTLISRAPKGHLDEFMAKKLAPPQLNPEWDQRIVREMTTSFQQYQAASNAQFQAIQAHFRQVTQGMLDRGKAFQDQQRSSFNSAMASDRANQNAIDQSAHETALRSLDRETFINPTNGQKIEASSEFNHQWISGDNQTLIQNQDHSFDPNKDVMSNQSWTELIPQY
jgi:hypothetical protein